ncbi:MAG: homoserine O-acetyltransferase [Chitinophagaceae bacterium]
MLTYRYAHEVMLECGVVLPELTVAYHTYGKLNPESDNVIWICHALTANADVMQWWPGVVGQQAVFDTDKYFIVCANILGSCYGSTGPLSVNPLSGAPYYLSFPPVTIRDMVKAHALLAEELGVKQIYLLAGGSMGGYQAIEWSVFEPGFIKQLYLIATSAQESAWGIAIHAAQRLAIEADYTWADLSAGAGKKGLQAARAIGMLTYRSYETYAITQAESGTEKLDEFRASSYINYQGHKLANRFNAHSYWLLTKAMDSHNIGRGRNASVAEVLQRLTARTLIIGITSDLLCPVAEQRFMSEHIPHNNFIQIDSLYGHDGFLVETAAIIPHLRAWLEGANS